MKTIVTTYIYLPVLHRSLGLVRSPVSSGSLYGTHPHNFRRQMKALITLLLAAVAFAASVSAQNVIIQHNITVVDPEAARREHIRELNSRAFEANHRQQMKAEQELFKAWKEVNDKIIWKAKFKKSDNTAASWNKISDIATNSNSLESIYARMRHGQETANDKALGLKTRKEVAAMYLMQLPEEMKPILIPVD